MADTVKCLFGTHRTNLSTSQVSCEVHPSGNEVYNVLKIAKMFSRSQAELPTLKKIRWQEIQSASQNTSLQSF